MASLTKPPFVRHLAALSALVILAACASADASTSPDAPPTTGNTTTPPAAAVISVAPGSQTTRVGDSTRYSAVVRDGSGVIRSDVQPSWSTGNASIATMRPDGTVIAQGVGTTTVTATALGRSTSVPLSVVAATAPLPAPSPTPAPAPAPSPAPTPAASSEPSYTAGVHLTLWNDDFNNTASTSSVYQRYVTQNGENGLTLDATAGLAGSKALRMDWSAKSGCTDDSHFVEGIFPSAQTEIVVQYSVRYQPGFVFDWIGRGGPCSGNAKKLFFLWAGSGSRFDFISENHVLGVGSDHDHPLFSQNVGTALRPDDLADGAWHRITLRVKQSSTPTATDGFIHGWVDGVQKWKIDNIASHASGGWTLFKFPATFNQGSPVNQSEWVDNIKVWRP